MAEKINFLGGLTDTLREEYKERLKYKKLINLDGLFDIWYNNYGYGTLNTNYEPVVLAEDPQIFTNFSKLADGVRCLGFVAKAFISFREEYSSVVDNSTLEFPPFIEQITPVFGYESFEELYAHWSEYSITKYSAALQENRHINDLDCFVDVIKDIFLRELPKFPVTKSGFCLSKQNDIKTTGLVIELADLNYDIDLQKGQMLQSGNFSCYMSLANKYGFYIDKNAPWRLLANLESQYMRSAIRGLKDYRSQDSQHRHLTTRQIFDSIYRVRTHFDDLYNLQDFVLRTYNQITRNVPSFTETVLNSDSNGIERIRVFRETGQTLKPEHWLNLLVFVRLLEINKYTKENYDFHTEKINRINRLYDLRRALSSFGADIASLIKEDFTSRSDSDTIIEIESRLEPKLKSRNVNGVSPVNTNSPNSGY
jgi:hypothetical protein